MAGFDLKKFRNTKFEPRFEDVPVPDLKDFFGEGAEAPVWRVRELIEMAEGDKDRFKRALEERLESFERNGAG